MMTATQIQKTLLYFHTIKYLKPSQIWYQIKYRFYQPQPDKLNITVLREKVADFIRPPAKSATVSGNTLKVLNQEFDISSQQIWLAKNIDKLWLYNLHYFDFLHSNSAQQEYTDISDAFTWQRELIHRWIVENPPLKGPGWEPYTISLRIVNWIKWLLQHNSNDSKIMESLALQTNYLTKRLEFHISGNHLLANAKALIFSGLFFGDRYANSWLKKGFKILTKEFKTQIHADGGHYELSPMYQAILLEDILDLINLHQVYNNAYAKQFNIITQKGTLVSKMLSWLKTMQHGDQHIAFFNDATLNIAPTYQELKAYASRLNVSGKVKVKTHLKESGFIRVQENEALLLADVGPIGATNQPGHGHADSLSFEFSLGKQRIFVNSGISTYNECIERIHQRGTAAHNTLTVNGHNSSEIWKSFRVGRRATTCLKHFLKEEQQTIIKACHNGYHNSFKLMHHRHWLMKANQLTIDDQVLGIGKFKINIYFHLHPGIKANPTSPKHIELYNSENTCIAIFTASHPIKILDSTYHPEFNLAIPNKKLMIEQVVLTPMRFQNTISWST